MKALLCLLMLLWQVDRVWFDMRMDAEFVHGIDTSDWPEHIVPAKHWYSPCGDTFCIGKYCCGRLIPQSAPQSGRGS